VELLLDHEGPATLERLPMPIHHRGSVASPR
jgi:hypothetical protein